MDTLRDRAARALNTLRAPEAALRQWVLENPPWSPRQVHHLLEGNGWAVPEGRIREAFRREGVMPDDWVVWVEWLEALAEQAKADMDRDPMPAGVLGWLERRAGVAIAPPPPPPGYALKAAAGGAGNPDL